MERSRSHLTGKFTLEIENTSCLALSLIPPSQLGPGGNQYPEYILLLAPLTWIRRVPSLLQMSPSLLQVALVL